MGGRRKTNPERRPNQISSVWWKRHPALRPLQRQITRPGLPLFFRGSAYGCLRSIISAESRYYRGGHRSESEESRRRPRRVWSLSSGGREGFLALNVNFYAWSSSVLRVGLPRLWCLFFPPRTGYSPTVSFVTPRSIRRRALVYALRLLAPNLVVELSTCSFV
jgi:hypothetical protein